MDIDIRRIKKGKVPTSDGRSFVPRSFTARTEIDALPGISIELDIEVSDRLQAHCSGLRLSAGSGQVTSETLRQIAVGRLAREAVATVASFFERDETAPGNFWMFPPADVAAEIFADARRPRRGIPLTDADLEEVADLYREAVAGGDTSPTLTISERKHVGRSTAARWVSRARARGYLGPAVRGRAGEEAT
jgi:hypothetical protein